MFATNPAGELFFLVANLIFFNFLKRTEPARKLRTGRLVLFVEQGC